MNKLKELVARTGLTQEQFAREAGMSYRTYWKILKGDPHVRDSYRWRIVITLNRLLDAKMTLDDLSEKDEVGDENKK